MIAVNGCLLCGIGHRDHCRRYAPEFGWHGWVAPTDALRLARLKANRSGRAAGAEAAEVAT